MEIRTAALVVAILGVGFGFGRMSAPQSRCVGSVDPEGLRQAAEVDTGAPQLVGRAEAEQAASDDQTLDLEERLDTIEQLLLSGHETTGMSGQPGKQVVERIKQMWIPIIRESLVHDRFERSKAGLTSYLARRVHEEQALMRKTEAQGGSTRGLIEHLRELERRLAAAREARTAQDLVAALTSHPEEAGAMEDHDAQAYVFGHVFPD